MNQTHRNTGFIRKNLILGCMSLLCLVSAQAEVIIYKHNILHTQRFDGSISQRKWTGWTVIDLQTGELAQVLIFPKDRFEGDRFLSQQPAAELASIGKSNHAKAVGIIALTEGFFIGAIAKGNNSSVDIGLSENWNIPRTLAVSGLNVSEAPFPSSIIQTNNFNLGEEPQVLEQFKGNMVFDRANTLHANSQSLNSEATLLYLRNLLLAKGYRDTDQPLGNSNGPFQPL